MIEPAWLAPRGVSRSLALSGTSSSPSSLIWNRECKRRRRSRSKVDISQALNDIQRNGVRPWILELSAISLNASLPYLEVWQSSLVKVGTVFASSRIDGSWKEFASQHLSLPQFVSAMSSSSVPRGQINVCTCSGGSTHELLFSNARSPQATPQGCTLSTGSPMT